MTQNTVATADVRYIVGNWSHIFSEREGSRSCRLVFDCEDNRIVALQIADATEHWRDASAIEVDDAQDSLLNANAEVLDEPEQNGLALTAVIPKWAAPQMGLPQLRINVRLIPSAPSNEIDSDVAGVYGVNFNRNVAGLSVQRLAEVALDIFHAHRCIKVLDDFEIVVINADGDAVGDDPTHNDGALADAGDVEKLSSEPVVPGAITDVVEHIRKMERSYSFRVDADGALDAVDNSANLLGIVLNEADTATAVSRLLAR